MDAERTVIGGFGAGGEGAAPPDDVVGALRGRIDRRDEGSSTVPAVGVAAVAVALALMVGTIGQGLGARSQADTAADLAALAAVQVAGDDGCGIAEAVAKRNGATVTECVARPDLGKATVTVEVPVGVRIPGKSDALTVSARAVAGRAE